VAQRFLGEVDLADDVRQACVQMVQTFHTTTQTSKEKFLAEQKRYYYVTPTSYLELINSFKRLLGIKRHEIMSLKEKYSNGYTCLVNTEQNVSKLEEQLEEKKPVLIETSKKVDEQAAIVETETLEAEKVREVVDADASVAQAAADKTQAIKDDCEKDLEAAMPALKAAGKALENITKKDITELKTIQKFHDDVYMVLSAVCILMDVAPENKMDPATQKKKKDFTGPAKLMMIKPSFLNDLQTYDRENIAEDFIKKLQPVLSEPNFNEAHLKGVNAVAANLACWVIAMDKFYAVNLVVKPKKAQLAVAQEEFAKVNAALDIKKAELKKVQDRVDALRRQLKEAQDEKQRL
jgi:dynein heavy chain